MAPGRAAVLPRDAAGLLPLLQEAGLIHDEHAGGGIAEMVDDVVPEVIADALGVPGGGVQETLHPMRPGLADRLCELPPVLALDALQQAGQVAPRPLPRFGARKAVSDPRVQLLPGLRAPLDRAQSESAGPFHDPLPWRKAEAYRGARLSVAVGGMVQVVEKSLSGLARRRRANA